VVCWDVIEHWLRPGDAILNVFQSMKPGGVLVLGFPNLLSFNGVPTKPTPHWLHQHFYRWMKYKSRPFPTYLRLAMLPERAVTFAQTNGLTVVVDQLRECAAT
jgi:2-polyprenyl-3-methyl-5-hydroxy-6-metoxy-1,4-benzoquinol methylase